MKKFKRIAISLLLIIAITVSFASCRKIVRIGKPKGYTGGLDGDGIGHYYNKEFHWVETYEEVMTAIDHLRAAGNDIGLHAIPDYENETVDAKYCFYVDKSRAKKTDNGDEWYDRTGLRIIEIVYVGFLENVTIEELEYSRVYNYKCFCTYEASELEVNPDDQLVYNCCLNDNGGCFVKTGSDGSVVFKVEYYNMDYHRNELPEDYKNAFPESIVFVGVE